MINTIPTEPEEFDLDQVKIELANVRNLLPKLESYNDREFRELPEKIQADIREIKTIVQPTVGGMEKVSGIIWQLWNSEKLCETIAGGQSAKSFIELFVKQKEPAPTPEQKPASVVPTATPAAIESTPPVQSPVTKREAPTEAPSIATITLPTGPATTSSSAPNPIKPTLKI